MTTGRTGVAQLLTVKQVAGQLASRGRPCTRCWMIERSRRHGSDFPVATLAGGRRSSMNESIVADAMESAHHRGAEQDMGGIARACVIGPGTVSRYVEWARRRGPTGRCRRSSTTTPLGGVPPGPSDRLPLHPVLYQKLAAVCRHVMRIGGLSGAPTHHASGARGARRQRSVTASVPGRPRVGGQVVDVQSG